MMQEKKPAFKLRFQRLSVIPLFQHRLYYHLDILQQKNIFKMQDPLSISPILQTNHLSFEHLS